MLFNNIDHDSFCFRLNWNYVYCGTVSITNYGKAGYYFKK